MHIVHSLAGNLRVTMIDTMTDTRREPNVLPKQGSPNLDVLSKWSPIDFFQGGQTQGVMLQGHIAETCCSDGKLT